MFIKQYYYREVVIKEKQKIKNVLILCMRKVIILLFLLISVVVNATTYYVATTGNDSYPGTINQPFLSWQYSFNKLLPGDILYVRGGTYTEVYGASGNSYFGVKISSSHSGTSTARITVTAYQNEIPVLDCVNLVSTNSAMTAGISVETSYWDFIGLSVTNVAEGTNHPAYGVANGWSVSGDYLTFKQCNSYHNGGGFAGGGDYVYFINCDAYENNDVYDNGGYANGWSCNIAVGDHVFYEGCRAWSNSDDGYDMYGGGQYASFNNCWAFENGDWGGYQGNGAGFKSGTIRPGTSGVLRSYTNCLSFNNIGIGYDESRDNENSAIHQLFNNVSYNDGVGFNYGYEGVTTDIIRNNICYQHKGVDRFGTNTVDHNSWQNGLIVTDADFAILNSSGVKGARKKDGSLPDLNFLHLSSKSKLIDAGVDVGLPYSGDAPDIGAFEITGSLSIPQFISGIVQNTTPNILELNYNLTLNSIVIPDIFSYNVLVNSNKVSLNSISISGNKVQLIISSDIKFGDVVIVSYTKSVNNPLQSINGGEAVSFSDILIINNINGGSNFIPEFISGVVQNLSPNILELNYNLNLNNRVIPDIFSYNVLVNSNKVSLNSISIFENTAQLILSSDIKFGDIITVSYTKPMSNSLQSINGVEAVSFSDVLIYNNIINDNIINPNKMLMTIFPNPAHNIVNILFEYSDTNPSQDLGGLPNVIIIADFSGKVLIYKLLYPGVSTVQIPINFKPSIYIVEILSGNLIIASQKIIVY